MEICVDADGTCFTHDYPNVGKDIGAVPVLKKLTDNGHNLIIFTMRSGKELNDVVKWYKDNEIPLYGIQTNPTQGGWTSSPKAYGQLYLDDAAAFAPLMENKALSKRPFIDWVRMEAELVRLGLIK